MDILVLGAGFAGLWAAIGAARRLDELGVEPGAVTVTVVSAVPFHDIRVAITRRTSATAGFP